MTERCEDSQREYFLEILLGKNRTWKNMDASCNIHYVKNSLTALKSESVRMHFSQLTL